MLIIAESTYWSCTRGNLSINRNNCSQMWFRVVSESPWVAPHCKRKGGSGARLSFFRGYRVCTHHIQKPVGQTLSLKMADSLLPVCCDMSLFVRLRSHPSQTHTHGKLCRVRGWRRLSILLLLCEAVVSIRLTAIPSVRTAIEDPGVRQTHSDLERVNSVRMRINLTPLSSASRSKGQSTFGTITGGFSNNSEPERIGEGKGFVSEWCIIIRLVSASSTQLSARKFSPEGLTICSFARSLSNPIDSLFPPPPPSTATHVTIANVRRLTPSLFHQIPEADHHRYPTPATPTPACQGVDPSGEDGASAAALPRHLRRLPWAMNHRWLSQGRDCSPSATVTWRLSGWYASSRHKINFAIS